MDHRPLAASNPSAPSTNAVVSTLNAVPSSGVSLSPVATSVLPSDEESTLVSPSSAIQLQDPDHQEILEAMRDNCQGLLEERKQGNPYPLSFDPQKALEVLEVPAMQRFAISLAYLHSPNEIRRIPDQEEQAVKRITEERVEVAVREYACFLKLAEATVQVGQGLNEMRQMTVSLKSDLDPVKAACKQILTELDPSHPFLQPPSRSDSRSTLYSASDRLNNDRFRSATHTKSDIGGLLKERDEMNTIMANYGAVVDLISIPERVEACLDSEAYDQALDLATQIQRLELRHGPLESIVRVHSRVRESMLHMQDQILSALRTDVNLSTCLRLVGYLRRLNASYPKSNALRPATGSELNVAFLKARLYFLKQALKAIPPILPPLPPAQDSTLSESRKSIGSPVSGMAGPDLDTSNAAAYLKLYIEAMRSVLIDIVTQYQAIFSSSSEAVYKNQSSGSLSVRPLALLSSFVLHVMDELFMKVLAAQLGRIKDFALLSTLVNQTMHFGVALARKGLDIRCMVIPLFERHCQQLMESLLDKSVKEFELELVENGMKNMLSATGTKTTFRSSSQPEIISPMSPPATGIKSKPVLTLTPPAVLLDIPPLAYLTNNSVQAFNALRMLPMLSLYTPLADALSSSFQALAHLMVQYRPVETDSEAATRYETVCQVMLDVWAPFVLHCFFDGMYAGVQSWNAKQTSYATVLQLFEKELKK